MKPLTRQERLILTDAYSYAHKNRHTVAVVPKRLLSRLIHMETVLNQILLKVAEETHLQYGDEREPKP